MQALRVARDVEGADVIARLVCADCGAVDDVGIEDEPKVGLTNCPHCGAWTCRRCRADYHSAMPRSGCAAQASKKVLAEVAQKRAEEPDSIYATPQNLALEAMAVAMMKLPKAESVDAVADDKCLWIFVATRADMPANDQVVQLGHACSECVDDGRAPLRKDTRMFWAHAPDRAAIEALRDELARKSVPHAPVVETDGEFTGQLTAVACLTDKRSKLRKIFHHFPKADITIREREENEALRRRVAELETELSNRRST